MATDLFTSFRASIFREGVYIYSYLGQRARLDIHLPSPIKRANPPSPPSPGERRTALVQP